MVVLRTPARTFVKITGSVWSYFVLLLGPLLKLLTRQIAAYLYWGNIAEIAPYLYRGNIAKARLLRTCTGATFRTPDCSVLVLGQHRGDCAVLVLGQHRGDCSVLVQGQHREGKIAPYLYRGNIANARLLRTCTGATSRRLPRTCTGATSRRQDCSVLVPGQHCLVVLRTPARTFVKIIGWVWSYFVLLLGPLLKLLARFGRTSYSC